MLPRVWTALPSLLIGPVAVPVLVYVIRLVVSLLIPVVFVLSGGDGPIDLWRTAVTPTALLLAGGVGWSVSEQQRPIVRAAFRAGWFVTLAAVAVFLLAF